MRGRSPSGGPSRNVVGASWRTCKWILFRARQLPKQSFWEARTTHTHTHTHTPGHFTSITPDDSRNRHRDKRDSDAMGHFQSLKLNRRNADFDNSPIVSNHCFSGFTDSIMFQLFSICQSFPMIYNIFESIFNCFQSLKLTQGSVNFCPACKLTNRGIVNLSSS